MVAKVVVVGDVVVVEEVAGLVGFVAFWEIV